MVLAILQGMAQTSTSSQLCSPRSLAAYGTGNQSQHKPRGNLSPCRRRMGRSPFQDYRKAADRSRRPLGRVGQSSNSQLRSSHTWEAWCKHVRRSGRTLGILLCAMHRCSPKGKSCRRCPRTRPRFHCRMTSAPAAILLPDVGSEAQKCPSLLLPAHYTAWHHKQHAPKQHKRRQGV